MNSRENTNESQTPAGDPRSFLEQFPPARRSTIANWFHYAYRSGAQTPEAVLQAVGLTIQRNLQWTRDPGRQAVDTAVRERLTTDRDAALAYAADVITYERMPIEQRRQVKLERSYAFLKEGMRGKPITAAQASYLKALGHQGPVPADRAEASALIDHLMQEREKA